MMKKILFLLLLIPAISRAQVTPITPSWSRVTTQTGDKDSIRMTYSGQVAAQWYYSSAFIRSKWLTKLDTLSLLATQYWTEHQPHTWYGDQTVNGNVIIPNGTNGLILSNNSVIANGATALLIRSELPDGIGLYYYGVPLFTIAGSGHGANDPYAKFNVPLRINAAQGGLDYGASGYNVLVKDNGTLGGGSGIGYVKEVPLINFGTTGTGGTTYTKTQVDSIAALKASLTQLNLKQPRVISALPTQTSTRPIVGDSVNQAIQKLTFRGDSLAGAVALRVKYTDTATMAANFVHIYGAETIRGAKTLSAQLNSQSIIPVTGGTYTNGSVTNNWLNVYSVKVQSSGTTFDIVVGGVTVFRLYNNGHQVVQNGGSYTDNGQALQVGGRVRVTQGLTGTAGTDSLLVHDNTSKELKLISPNYYAVSSIAKIDNYLAKSANYTVLTTDWAAGKTNVLFIDVDATAGSVTITLPAASALNGYQLYVAKTDATANTVTINTVVGGSTIISQDQSRQFNSNGTNWRNR